MSEQAKPEITPGPWELCVLDMPLADVPEYVRQCIDASGGADYHFVRAKNADGEWVDVCHVGNGPMGNFNGHYIAQLPALLDEITALRAALDQERARIRELAESPPMASISLCCGIVRPGRYDEGAMHSALCRRLHGGELGKTYYLHDVSALLSGRGDGSETK